MSTSEAMKPDPAETTRKLRTLEEEWRERKSRRLMRVLGDAAEQLRSRFSGYTSVTVEKGERVVVVKVGADRELSLYMRLNFDDDGLIEQSFRVRDKHVRRRPDFEELENEHTFDTLDQAVSFVVRACE